MTYDYPYLYEKKLASGLVEIKTQVFRIPDHIICPKDGELMYYNAYHRSYYCSKISCLHEITAEKYIKSMLEKCDSKTNEI